MKKTTWAHRACLLFLVVWLLFLSQEALPDRKNKGTTHPTASRISRDEAPMVTIQAGYFLRGSSELFHAQPESRVYLSSYRIDKYEVTVNRFKKCVQAGRCARRDFYRNKKICNYGQTGRGEYPMNCVNWRGARAYCRWTGKDLCSEAQWEKAARGANGRKFPWGNTKPTCKQVNSIINLGCGGSWIRKVGSLPQGATPEGVMDLADNVNEWVLDCYYSGFYRKNDSRRRDPCKGCRSAFRKCETRGVRGYLLHFNPPVVDFAYTQRSGVSRWGGYLPHSSPPVLHVANRSSYVSFLGAPDLGFRCCSAFGGKRTSLPEEESTL